MRVQRLSLAFLAVVCLACDGGSKGVTEPFGVVSRVDVEPPGQHCSAGGQAVHLGLDRNGNGSLDVGEETSVQYLCAEPTRTLLVASRPEPAGVNCAMGGTAVLAGLDRDGDGALSDGEVDQTRYVCADALPPVLVTTTALPPDATCSAGGTRVESGPDRNRSGVLDAEEVEHREVVCGAHVLVATDEVRNADACPSGRATRVRSGADVDGDETLADGEVTSTSYVCSAMLYGYTVRDQADLDYLVRNVSLIRGDLIVESPSLVDVSISLVVVTGSIHVRDCPRLKQLAIWPDMLGRDIEVARTPALTWLSINLSPMSSSNYDLPILGDLTITDAPLLDSLDLEYVPAIRGSLTLLRTGLQSLFAGSVSVGTPGLREIGGSLTIEQCDRLRYLDLRDLARVGGAVVLRGNTAPFDEGRFTLGIESVGAEDRYGADVVVEDNTALGSFRLPSLRAVTGGIYVHRNPELGYLEHPALASVGDSYEVTDNATLTDLGGFSSDTPPMTIGDGLRVERNPALRHLAGLGRLVQADIVAIRDNPSLKWAALASLDSAYHITFQRNDALEYLGTSGFNWPDADTLTHLRSCAVFELYDNPNLARLELPMLVDLDTLNVEGNPRLPTCQVQAIVDRTGARSTHVAGTDDTATCP